MFIALLSWIVVGTFVGFIASKKVNLHGDDPKLGLACGAAGAVAGGIMHRIVTGVAIDGFNMWSVAYAVIGAVLVVGIWHLMRRRSARV